MKHFFANLTIRARLIAGFSVLVAIALVIPPFLTGFKSRPQAIMANFC
ncbi:hypothetical protein Q672_13175 [Marinobacter sp. EVN1]|jgi:hypothetical protein|nr:hypothetical protein [Marinobacter sp. G11]ERS87394.1 hypothetical protein Q672_13175 [Marinobacter sp. EVN1]MCE0760289.1 hypothetical protein [Marinobacter sp. G11]